MPNVFQSIYTGTLLSERTLTLFTVPDSGPGVIVTGVMLHSPETVTPDPANFWVFTFGVFPGPGRPFQARSLVPMTPTTLPAGVPVLKRFTPPQPVGPGETFAMKTEIRGVPGLVVDLSVTPVFRVQYESED